MKEYIEEQLEGYIENEINYINQENATCGFDKGRFKDLLMLETISDKEKEDIVDKILNDDNLDKAIDELIHYYLYHK